jgi:hypothetical protein
MAVRNLSDIEAALISDDWSKVRTAALKLAKLLAFSFSWFSLRSTDSWALL